MKPRRVLQKFVTDFIKCDKKVHSQVLKKINKRREKKLKRLIKTADLFTVFEIAFTMSKSISSPELTSALQDLKNQILINLQYPHEIQEIKNIFIFMIKSVFNQSRYLESKSGISYFSKRKLIICVKLADEFTLLNTMKDFSEITYKVYFVKNKDLKYNSLIGSFTAFIPILEESNKIWI